MEQREGKGPLSDPQTQMGQGVAAAGVGERERSAEGALFRRRSRADRSGAALSRAEVLRAHGRPAAATGTTVKPTFFCFP